MGGDVGQEGNLQEQSMAEGLWCVHLQQLGSVQGKQRCVVEHLVLREQKPVALLLCCLLHRGDDLWLLHFSLVTVGFAASLLFATGTSCDPAKKPIFILVQEEEGSSVQLVVYPVLSLVY